MFAEMCGAALTLVGRRFPDRGGITAPVEIRRVVRFEQAAARVGGGDSGDASDDAGGGAEVEPGAAAVGGAGGHAADVGRASM